MTASATETRVDHTGNQVTEFLRRQRLARLRSVDAVKTPISVAVQVITIAAPVLTILAVATVFIPGIDALTASCALAANAVAALSIAASVADAASTVISTVKFAQDMNAKPGKVSTTQKVLDGTSAGLGWAGISLGGINGTKLKGIAAGAESTASFLEGAAGASGSILSRIGSAAGSSGPAAGRAALSMVPDLRAASNTLDGLAAMSKASASVFGGLDRATAALSVLSNVVSNPNLAGFFLPE